MTRELVLDYYSSPEVVSHYSEATTRLGLWVSEEKVLTRVFRKEDTLLDLGCGTGRIALGLWELGYRNVLGIDPSKPMIEEARRLSRTLEYGVPFRVGDATRLDLGEALFDGIVFGFNGLMQIPGRDNRRRALARIFAHLRPGGWFVFTAHDREASSYPGFWREEKKRWAKGKVAPDLVEYGDRCEETILGRLWIHVPDKAEVIADLKEAGFRIEADILRSHVAEESFAVREFADDTRFWVAQRPVEG